MTTLVAYTTPSSGRPDRGLAAGGATSASGSETVNVAPEPVPGLSAWTVPPWRSTMCLAMARPRPSPVDRSPTGP